MEAAAVGASPTAAGAASPLLLHPPLDQPQPTIIQGQPSLTLTRLN